MKKVILTMLILCIAVSPAFARRPCRGTPSISPVTPHNTAGVKLDAPNLVKITKNFSAGLEGGKDILTNAFYPDDLEYFEDDRGYFAYLKFTYSGTLFDFTD